jgi:hypothetical protein
MRRYPWIVILSLSSLALPAAAAGRLTVDEVRDMAFAQGIVTIKEIELDDGIWEVEGRTAPAIRSKSRLRPAAARS